MRARALIAAPLLFAAGCAMPPEGVDAPQVALFDNAVKSMGCELVSEPHYLATELQTGLSRDQIIAMVQYKVATKQAELMEDGGYRFMSEGCV